MAKKREGKGNVELFIGGVRYAGMITGIRQDTDMMNEWGSSEPLFCGKITYITITFGGGTFEMPVSEDQYIKLMKELQNI